jgi:hypothetical protein
MTAAQTTFIFPTADGELDAGETKSVAEFAASLRKPGARLLLHLHGGLVDEQHGRETANRLMRPPPDGWGLSDDWTQAYVVWRTGIWETIQNNWTDLAHNDRLASINRGSTGGDFCAIFCVNCANQCRAASVDQRRCKPSRPGGGLVCMALKSPVNGRDRSIATEMRCLRDVRSSLNFRHDVVTSRMSKWAMCGRLQVGKDFLHACSIGRCGHVFGLRMRFT